MKTIRLGNFPEDSYQMKESLRALKTNIQFCGDDVKTILVTSTAPNEGKSTVVLDLARSMSESGKSVLVIDADIRKSVLVGRLRAKSESGSIYGLSHFLSGQHSLDDCLCTTNVQNLYMIFAGPSVPNPTEILDNHYFEELMRLCKEKFDYILIDCPPIGAAIDAAVIARHVDGAIIVVAQGMMQSRAIMNTKKQLETSNVRILGAVLNKAKVKHSVYGKYYGNYYGNYYGGYYGNYGSYGTYGDVKPEKAASNEKALKSVDKATKRDKKKSDQEVF